MSMMETELNPQAMTDLNQAANGCVLISVSDISRIYRSPDGMFHIVCQCGRQSVDFDIEAKAQDWWRKHWTTQPYCTMA